MRRHYRNPLVVVEASGKVEFLRESLKAIGVCADVMATNGHISDNPSTLSPIGLDSRLNETSYALKPEKVGMLQRIHDAARGADVVFLAMDDDQEGDVIAYDLANVMPDCFGKLFRVRLRAMSESELEKAFSPPHSQDFETPSRNGRCRRIVDRAIGAAFSELTTPSRVVVGRVQSSLLISLQHQKPPLGVFNLSVRTSEGVYRSVAQVADVAHLERLRELQAALADGKADAYELEPEERPCGQPWGYEEIVVEASRRLSLGVSDAAKGLQLAYEKGKVSYPRARKDGFTHEAGLACADLAKRNRASFDPTKLPKRRDDGESGAHECPRPLDASIVLGRSLAIMDTADAVATLVARNTLECGQVESVKRLKVAACGLELEFCTPLTAPRRSWKPAEEPDGFSVYTPAQSLLIYMAGQGLGRPSTIVDHVDKFLKRGLVDPDRGFAFTAKGERWLAHVSGHGFTSETSRLIEKTLGGPIDDPALTARYLLGQHGLLEQVLKHVRKDLNNQASHSYQELA